MTFPIEILNYMCHTRNLRGELFMKKMIFGAAIMFVTVTTPAEKEEVVLHDIAQTDMPIKEVQDDKQAVVPKDNVSAVASAEIIPVKEHVDQKSEALPNTEAVAEKTSVVSPEEKSLDTSAPKALEEKKVVAPTADAENSDIPEKKKDKIDAFEAYASDDGEDEVSIDAEPIDESFDSLDANEKSPADMSVDDEEEVKSEVSEKTIDGEDTFSGSSNLDAF